MDNYGQELTRVTNEIRRLINIFKSQDNVPEDLKQEFVALDDEKQRIKTELEKLRIETNRRRQHVVDLDIIERSLQENLTMRSSGSKLSWRNSESRPIGGVSTW